MIDSRGYRTNVGILIANKVGELFWGRRVRARGWQFPQGGVRQGESIKEAMYRELYEETGLNEKDVELLAVTKEWFSYRLPKHFINTHRTPTCIGQRQKWFLLLLTGDDQCLNLLATDKPEFKSWRWVKYWFPMRQVIYFKRHVYFKALKELEPVLESKIGSLKEESQLVLSQP